MNNPPCKYFVSNLLLLALPCRFDYCRRNDMAYRSRASEKLGEVVFSKVNLIVGGMNDAYPAAAAG